MSEIDHIRRVNEKDATGKYVLEVYNYDFDISSGHH